MKLVRLLSAFVLTASLFAGCAAEDADSNGPGGGPRVISLAKSKLVVGEPVTFLGTGFLNPSNGDGVTKLVFDGVFIVDNTDGSVSPPESVDGFTIQPLYDAVYTEDVLEVDGVLAGRTVAAGTTMLRWNRFGPFSVPFGPGNKPGTFNGTVRPVNYLTNGILEEGEAVEVTIKVEPSIIIKRLEPITGFKDGQIETPRCAVPAVRGLGGMPYLLEVEAIGFEPAFFRYEFSGVQNGPIVITHQANGRTDRVGDPTFNADDKDHPIVFKQLTDTEGASLATVRIIGVTADNKSYETGLPIRIVRPISVFHNGKREVAQYYEPVVVNGPTTGSIGTTLTYSETESESRQRGVSVTVSKTFTQSQNNVQSENWSEGISEGNTQSTTNSQGVAHSESESSSEAYGQQVSTSEAANVEVSSAEGSVWGWNTAKGKSEEEYESETTELFGEATASINTSATAEGSVPGFAKVSGTVGTTVGATVGASNGGQNGKRESINETTGSSMGGSTGQTDTFGSTTTDAKSSSFTGQYAVSSQSSVNQNTSVGTVDSKSKTFNMGGSGSVSDGVSEGSAEAWTETYVDTTSKSSTLSTSASVPSGACAKVMRQTIRWARVAQIYNYDLCGVRSLAGETVFTEWSWASEIPVGKTCEDAQPNFPKAECFIACE